MVEGVHPACGTEEASAGPCSVLLHTHQGGNIVPERQRCAEFDCGGEDLSSVLQLSVWMEGLQKQLSTDLCVSPDSVEALQTLINQQQQQQANTQVPADL